MAEQPGPSERDFSQNTKCLLKKHRICAILKKGPKISEIQNSREVKLELGQAGTCDLEVGNFPAKLSKAPPSSLGGSLCLLCLEAKKYTHETNTYYTQPYHPSKVKENTPSTHPTLK